MARPGQPLLTYESEPFVPVNPFPHPLTFLQNVLVYLDPASSYVTLNAGKVASFTNRGSLGAVAPGAGSTQSPYLASDPGFNGKPTWQGDGSWYQLPNLPNTGQMERFAVGVHDVESPAAANTGFEAIGMSDTSDYYTTNIPHTSGTIHDGFCEEGPAYSFPKPTGFTTPWIINTRHGNQSDLPWQWIMNGSVRFTATGRNFQFHHPSEIMRSRGTSAAKFKGRWALYIVCGTVQTQASRAKFEAWARAEYALTAIPDHPLYFLKNVLVYVDPKTAYVQLSGSNILRVENRGSLGGYLMAYASNPVYVAADPAFNGKPVLRGPALQLPSLPTNLTGVERFVIGAHDDGNPTDYLKTGFDNVGPSAVAAHIPLNGVVYDNFGSATRWEFPSMPKASFEAPWAINTRSSSTEWTWRFNGADRFVAGSPAFSVPGGAGVGTILRSANGAINFVGRWALYALCASVQTPEIRAQFEAWAKAEYGIAALP